MSMQEELISLAAKTAIELSRAKEALRWRKWPEERPEKVGNYLIETVMGSRPRVDYWCIGDIENNERPGWMSYLDAEVTHWLPIPPIGE